MSITAKDKRIFSECLRILETLGEFAGEFGGGAPVLKAVCKELYEFAEIASWYKLTLERKRIFLVFRKISQSPARASNRLGQPVMRKRRLILGRRWYANLG